MSETIKLYKIGEINGTQRFQSQLWIGCDAADFIMRSDEIMRTLRYGSIGLDYYEFNQPYEIVSNISEMSLQKL